MDDFAGRVAVITGGASGIGLALAEACIARGMRVVIADIEAAALATASESLGAYAIQTDVADPASVADLASEVHANLGGCDLLFNNAGVGGFGRISDQSLDDWDWVLGVNLHGVVHVLHAFLPILRANPRGAHLVNTASVAGLTALVSGPYTAAKYAVVGISETLRRELRGTSVGVSVLCPGFVKTKIGTSDRNRPGTSARHGESASTMAFVRANKFSFLDPTQVAAMTLSAVEANQFWIVTDPSILAFAKPRYDELAAIAEEGTQPSDSSDSYRAD